MASELLRAFIQDLIKLSMTCPRDVLRLSVYLWEKPFPKVERLYASHPKDTVYVGTEILRSWWFEAMASASDSYKLAYLRATYEAVDKLGVFEEGEFELQGPAAGGAGTE